VLLINVLADRTFRYTEAGHALSTTTNGMGVWTRTYLDHIEEARRRFGSARAV
jgi:DNA-binding HxlR family transcriptional regulator